MGAQYMLWPLCLCAKLCWSCVAKRLRGEEHVAVVGQGVCASHRWLPHAQQVALHWLPRIELLWLGLGEENSQGAGRMVASL